MGAAGSPSTPGAGPERLNLWLNQSEGGRERRVYTQLAGIQQGRIGGRLLGGDGAIGVPLVPLADFLEDLGLIRSLAVSFEFQPAAVGAHCRAGIDEKLGGGIGADDGSDVPAIDHSAGLAAGEGVLIVEQGGAYRVVEDETGILWRQRWRWEAWAAVEVVNGTPEPDGTYKRYFLQVPPTVRTPREGVAWSYGLSERQYRLVIRT